jgi:hypothetical protein
MGKEEEGVRCSVSSLARGPGGASRAWLMLSYVAGSGKPFRPAGSDLLAFLLGV